MAEWVAIALTLGFAIVSTAYLWGKMDERQEAISDRLDKHDEHHAAHFKHVDDEDAHWTGRERDELTKKLDAIHSDLQDLTRRMYGDS